MRALLALFALVTLTAVPASAEFVHWEPEPCMGPESGIAACGTCDATIDDQAQYTATCVAQVCVEGIDSSYSVHEDPYDLNDDGTYGAATGVRDTGCDGALASTYELVLQTIQAPTAAACDEVGPLTITHPAGGAVVCA